MATETEVQDTGTTQETGNQSGTHQSGRDYSNEFLGDPEEGESEASEQTPEPALAESESTAITEGDDSATTGEATGETAEAEETGDEWQLPANQEKKFPLDILAEYAKRRDYGYSLEQIKADTNLQNLLRDKLNSDIHIVELRSSQGGQEQDTNPFDEAEAPDDIPENKDAAQATAVTANDPRTAHYQRVDSLIGKIDDSAIKEIGRGLLSAMGVNTDTAKLQRMLADPKLTPQQRGEVQGALTLAQGASGIGKTLARAALDLFMTTGPMLFEDWAEQAWPGTKERAQYQTQYNGCRTAWDAIAQRKGENGKPVYANLPKFGSQEFKELSMKAEKQLGLPEGGLYEMTFEGIQGRPSEKEISRRAFRTYAMVARVASGQQVSPQVVAQAVASGRKQAEDTTRRREQGRAMGAGAASRTFNQPKTGDALRDNLRAAIFEANEEEAWDRKA